MKKPILLLLFSFALIFSSCSEDGEMTSESDLSSDSFSEGSSSSGGGNGNGEAGKITAGEWNDLYHWDFWTSILNQDDYKEIPDYWSLYTNNRISVKVQSPGASKANATVELYRNGSLLWKAKTDNLGYAELFAASFQKDNSIKASDLTIRVNDQTYNQPITYFENGTNTINLTSSYNTANKLEISFIVDATGSMGDELEFLKEDLKSVIDRVKNNNPNNSIRTSTVFYRDEGDDYVVKKSDFTTDLNSTINFINNQNAAGGGDFPEAVHTALKTGINELQWSDDAKTRIAFLLLDAPPHYEPGVITDLQTVIKEAAAKGIKIIPITASGIDKKTEFLMRSFSVLSNSTYVFITDDSGIGGEHLEPTVGEYQVELLNDLMVRLIKKYSE